MLTRKLRAPCWSIEEITAHITTAPDEFLQIDTEDIGLLRNACGGAPRGLRGFSGVGAEIEMKRGELRSLIAGIDIAAALRRMRFGYMSPRMTDEDNIAHQALSAAAPRKGDTFDHTKRAIGHASKMTEDEMKSRIRKLRQQERYMLRASAAAQMGDAGGHRGNLLQNMSAGRPCWRVA